MRLGRGLSTAIGIVVALSALARAESVPASLLSQTHPVEARGARAVEQLTDETAVVEGDFWQTSRSTRLRSPDAFVLLDLGVPVRASCVLLQADNDDVYRLERSLDGERFEELWAATAVPGAGMRTRTARIDGTLRFLRLRAESGDGRYAVAELALWESCPAGFPEVSLARVAGTPLVDVARFRIWLFGVAAIVFLLATGRGASTLRYAFALAPLATFAAAASTLVELRPFFGLEPDVLAVVALVALVLVLLEAFAPERRAPHPKVTLATLVVLATLSIGCYFHFGSPQFRHAGAGRPTWVHLFDMRHYFPSAKYFSELRYDGLYLASAAAYAELAANGDLGSVQGTSFRDLDTYEMTRGGKVTAKILGVRDRFTPERWEEFERDMAWFLEAMGPRDYLGSMRDHGGNATPVWLIGGWLLFRDTEATERNLVLAALIDPALLALLFLVIGRTFGLRVALYTAVLFGATDFYQFGSNLVGSTLRQDWLVALGLGVCALAAGRGAIGGATLAYGGLIRAFPALAPLSLLLPIFWRFVEPVRSRRGPPGIASTLRSEPVASRGVAGTALAVVLLIGTSTALFGFEQGWQTWISKIRLHAVEPSINNVGLRNIVAHSTENEAERLMRADHPEPWVDWQTRQTDTFERRRLLFYAIVAVATLLAILASRGRPPHQAAVLGLLLVPIYFYPSNYYCHFVFLLPLAAAPAGPAGPRNRELAWVVAVVAALCVAQYATLSEPWSDVRYTEQSYALLAAVAAILLPFARTGSKGIRLLLARIGKVV